MIRLFFLLLFSCGFATAAELILLKDGTHSAWVECNFEIPAGNERCRFDRTFRVLRWNANGVELLRSFGISDEFGIHRRGGVFGYEQAGYSGNFMKIGVGILKKNDNRHYWFETEFPIVRQFPNRIVSQGKNFLEAVQDGEFGIYRYRYSKKIILDGKSGSLRFRYRFQNTGNTRLEVEHYNHSYLSRNDSVWKAGTVLNTDFPLEPFSGKWMEIVGERKILLKQEITSRFYYSSELAGDGGSSRLTLTMPGTRGTLSVSADASPFRFALYVEKKAICPEIFLRKTVPQGENVTWTRTFQWNDTEVSHEK